MRSLDYPDMKKALEFFLEEPSSGGGSLLRAFNLRWAAARNGAYTTREFKLSPDEVKLIVATLNLMGIE